MIAAIAVAADVPVYTCNPKDFEGIAGLDVVAVPHPDHVDSANRLRATEREQLSSPGGD